MKQFVRTVHDCGYRQFYLAFGDGNLRFEQWARSAGDLGGELGRLVEFFLLMRPGERVELESIFGAEFLAELLAAGVVVAEGTRVRTNDFLLIVARGLLYFCQLSPDAWAYFGDDSLALASYQTPATEGRTLDLCSGPGLQAFVSARHATDCVGIELDARTVAVAAINARLNDLETRVRFVTSSLEAFAQRSAESFDLITFNPPLVPAPARAKYSRAGHGGDSGTLVSERIINLYGDRVVPEGRMEFVGIAVGSRDSTQCLDRLDSLAHEAGFASRFHLLSRHPVREGAPFFEQYAKSYAYYNRRDLPGARKLLLRHYARGGHTDLCFFFCSLHKRRGRRRLRRRVVDLSLGYYGDWFV
jgi:release factor glutamine methyltransferase